MGPADLATVGVGMAYGAVAHGVFGMVCLFGVLVWHMVQWYMVSLVWYRLV